MCGIGGKIVYSGEVTQKELSAISQKIAHRGPDDEGFYLSSDKRVGLVNRRLAIVDLTKRGHMPMEYLKRYFITYNGEVYNFRKEREKLIKMGYKFVSNTDTEVIVALYDKYGKACLKHLRGMFAFAIWDSKEKCLFAARDRLGKKPFKYCSDNSSFIFASELKAILTQKEIKAEPDFLAINHFLTFGYVPAPLTGFQGIKKLPPAHYLFLDSKTRKLEIKKYWQPDFSCKLNLSEEEWSERILNELIEATRLRMIADVAVGAFLSGGIDSSAVVAIMAMHSKKPVKTFTIGFKEKRYDESEHALRVSKLYKTDHTELVVEPASVELLPELVYQYEEPYADASAIVTYLVCELARKHVKVVLNGDGGDENFCGYDNRYIRLRRDIKLDMLLSAIRPVGIPLTARTSKRLNKFLVKSKLPLSHRFATYVAYFLNAEKEKLYGRRPTSEENSYRLFEEKFAESGTKDVLEQALYTDLTQYLPEDLLAKVDIASMAVSLEARSPFLDHKLVELTAKIPFDLKLRGSQTKYILKKTVEKIVPKENIYRPKRGFSVPLSTWFEGDFRKFAEGYLLADSAKTKEIFSRPYVLTMLKTQSETNDFGPKLWALLTLELWFQKYF